MGALSSWASLALSHHIIVQVAALRVGVYDFNHYALLGDDIVIANEKVASAYHSIMVQTLGVDINMSKTLVSDTSFEFAKRLVTVQGELSPIGAKNLLLCLKSLNGIPSVFYDLVTKNFAFDEKSVESLFTNVPTVRKSRMEQLK